MEQDEYLEELYELLEDLEDLIVLIERSNEPTIPHNEVIAQLKRDGLLPNQEGNVQ